MRSAIFARWSAPCAQLTVDPRCTPFPPVPLNSYVTVLCPGSLAGALSATSAVDVGGSQPAAGHPVLKFPAVGCLKVRDYLGSCLGDLLARAVKLAGLAVHRFSRVVTPVTFLSGAYAAQVLPQPSARL